jgi:hypothetical protein
MWNRLEERVAMLSLLALLLASMCFIANFLLVHLNVGVNSDKITDAGIVLVLSGLLGAAAIVIRRIVIVGYLALIGFYGLGALIVRYTVIVGYLTGIWVLMAIFGEPLRRHV